MDSRLVSAALTLSDVERDDAPQRRRGTLIGVASVAVFALTVALGAPAAAMVTSAGPTAVHDELSDVALRKGDADEVAVAVGDDDDVDPAGLTASETDMSGSVPGMDSASDSANTVSNSDSKSESNSESQSESESDASGSDNGAGIFDLPPAATL